MSKKEKDAEKYCEYCRYAVTVSLTDDMICEKRGIVSKDYSCRKFIYDPLKRMPRKLPAIPIPEDLADDI